MKESKIIKGLQKGDQKVLRYLYDHYGNLFFGIAQRYLSDISEAEDAVQETFIKIYKNAGTFKNKGSFEGWMKRILVNNCLNRIKANRGNVVMENLDDQITENATISHEEILEKLHSQEIIEVIQNLPTGYRTVLNLYVLEGYAHKEIAEMLGIQESASRSQLVKARARLKKELVKFGLISSERVA